MKGSRPKSSDSVACRYFREALSNFYSGDSLGILRSLKHLDDLSIKIAYQYLTILADEANQNACLKPLEEEVISRLLFLHGDSLSKSYVRKMLDQPNIKRWNAYWAKMVGCHISSKKIMLISGAQEVIQVVDIFIEKKKLKKAYQYLQELPPGSSSAIPSLMKLYKASGAKQKSKLLLIIEKFLSVVLKTEFSVINRAEPFFKIFDTLSELQLPYDDPLVTLCLESFDNMIAKPDDYELLEQYSFDYSEEVHYAADACIRLGYHFQDYAWLEYIKKQLLDLYSDDSTACILIAIAIIEYCLGDEITSKKTANQAIIDWGKDEFRYHHIVSKYKIWNDTGPPLSLNIIERLGGSAFLHEIIPKIAETETALTPLLRGVDFANWLPWLTQCLNINVEDATNELFNYYKKVKLSYPLTLNAVLYMMDHPLQEKCKQFADRLNIVGIQIHAAKAARIVNRPERAKEIIKEINWSEMEHDAEFYLRFYPEYIDFSIKSLLEIERVTYDKIQSLIEMKSRKRKYIIKSFIENYSLLAVAYLEKGKREDAERCLGHLMFLQSYEEG
ncbi:Hypothetical protein PBC10988_40410 [Planctomycetales bacterium 10988]|nr:Hypothetical protein PBC10988_40410 [Planctomycetales bacterium 10988]